MVVMQTPIDGLTAEATSRARSLRQAMEDAMEELHAETTHCKKFLWRGDGLRTDFANARRARRRALVMGVSENEAALCRALKEAEAVGLDQEDLEESIRVANELAVARTELQQSFLRMLEREESARCERGSDG